MSYKWMCFALLSFLLLLLLPCLLQMKLGLRSFLQEHQKQCLAWSWNPPSKYSWFFLHCRLYYFIQRKPKGCPKIWKKWSKNQNKFDLGQELVRTAHWNAQWIDFSEDLNQIKTNEYQWRSWSCYIYKIYQRPCRTLLCKTTDHNN